MTHRLQSFSRSVFLFFPPFSINATIRVHWQFDILQSSTSNHFVITGRRPLMMHKMSMFLSLYYHRPCCALFSNPPDYFTPPGLSQPAGGRHNLCSFDNFPLICSCQIKVSSLSLSATSCSLSLRRLGSKSAAKLIAHV